MTTADRTPVRYRLHLSFGVATLYLVLTQFQLVILYAHLGIRFELEISYLGVAPLETFSLYLPGQRYQYRWFESAGTRT